MCLLKRIFFIGFLLFSTTISFMAHAANCPEGWTGDKCKIAAKCPYKTSVCAKGFHATGNSCKTGNKTVIECEPDACEGFNYAKCPAGYQISAMCQSGEVKKYKCDNCQAGYIFSGGICAKELKCQNGGYQKGDKCVCSAGWSGELCQTKNICTYDTTSCSGGYEETGNTCKSGNITYVECRDAACEDYPLSSTPDNCKTVSQCPSDSSKYRCDKCSSGYGKDSSGNCVKKSSALILTTDDRNNGVKETVNNEYRNVYGLTNDNTNNHYNAYNGEATIKITNNSDGTTYGVNSDKASSHNAYANSTSVSFGEIEIHNNGNGGTYGLRGLFGATNAQTNSGDVEGNIKIENVGNGNVFGMQTVSAEFSEGQTVSDVLTKNAESIGGTAIASIDIDNTGAGMVHGMNAGSTGVNSLSNSNGASNGTIKIKNSGDGEVRGMSAEYLAQNATSKMSENEAEISIENVGDGNVKGIHSNGYAHNAASYTGADTTASIIIKNRGNGDIAAITSADIRDSSSFNTNNETYYYFNDVDSYHLYNARANNGTASGIIDIQDEGNGDITVFDTIINNNDTFANYTGNITYNTYAINNGTANSNIKIKNESSNDTKKMIAISKDTLNLAYAENKGKATNTIEINNGGKSDIVLSRYDNSKASKMTAKDNSSIDNSIKITSKGDGNIILPISATSNNSIIKNTIDIDNQGDGLIKATFDATTENNKEVSSNIKVKNNGNGNIEIKNKTGTNTTKGENKVEIEDTGDGNVSVEISSGTATGVGNTVNSELSITKSGNGSVSLKHDNNYAVASDGGTATNKINLNLSGNNPFSWQSSETTPAVLASASGSSKASSATSELNIIRDGHTGYFSLPSFNISASGLGEVYNKINITNTDSTGMTLGLSISGEVDNKIDITNISSGDLSLNTSIYSGSSSVTINNTGDNKINISTNNWWNGCALQNVFNITNEGNGDIDVSMVNTQTTIINKGNGNINSSALYNAILPDSSSNIANGSIRINNTGGGNIYGIHGENAKNNNGSSSSIVNGEITITNDGNGDIYGGIYSNASSSSSGSANGTINIANEGAGDIYGIYGGEVSAYNASSSSSGSANGAINITNDGDGNIYGMHGNFNVYNAHNNKSSDSGNANGVINITNEGAGGIYGIYGSGTYKYNQYGVYGGSKSGSIYNAYNNESSSAVIEGMVNITNSSSGNVYGMYSDEDSYIYNAYNDETSSDVVGKIRITNNTSGNAYGLYSNGNGWVHNSYGKSSGAISVINNSRGIAYGIYSGNGNAYNVYNEGGIGKISVVNADGGYAYGMYGKYVFNDDEIDVVNAGNGVVIGMYSKDGTVWNSGDIKIHNLADGVAIGLYADDSTTATNRGNITIDRESYTDDMDTDDTSDDITYYADTTQKSLAIGMYGTKNTTIINEGTITINDAEYAYGIWSEGIDVINSGTININDNSNHKRSIVLNGGTLFQDGIMNVNSDIVVGNNGCAEGMKEFYGYCYVDLHCEAYNATQIRDVCVCDDMDDSSCLHVALLNEEINNNSITIESVNDFNVYGMYGRKYNDNYVHYIYNAYNSSSDANGILNIVNNGKGNAYGMYVSGNYSVYNAYGSSSNKTANGTITITNNNSGNAYGIFNSQYGNIINAYGSSSNKTANGTINITNNSSGNAYGIFNSHYGNIINAEEKSSGTINIINNREGNAYGMYSKGNSSDLYYNAKSSSSVTTNGTISITNISNGDAYGMFGKGSGFIYNAYSNTSEGKYNRTNGKIRILNSGSGNAHGMYSNKSSVYNANSSLYAYGMINIVNTDSGNAYGMYGKSLSNESPYYEHSIIEMANVGSGLVVGMYSKDGTVENSGEIKIHNLADGTAVGIYADGTTNVTNSGTITIDRASYTDDMATTDTSDDYKYTKITSWGGVAFGIYGGADSTIVNDENGVISISGAALSYGIYTEGGNVSNSGKITIGSDFCTGTDCTSENNAIVLNGGKLFQNGVLTATSNPQNNPMSVSSVKPASLNLNDFGGTVVASDTSQFIVEGSISGDLAINNSVIENGFDTTYSVKNMIQAEDTSGLNLQSQSALFDATLQNNTDAVMTMKAFNDVVENSSVAEFLKQNYTAQNNEALFNMLKGKKTLAALNDTINNLTGAYVFSRFTFEDLTMLRDLNADMNNTLFANKKEKLEIVGNITPWNFDGNQGSNARYALYNTVLGHKSFGLGLAFSDIHSNNGRNNKDNRYDQTFQMSVPMGYNAKGFKFIVTPRFGYAYGTYERTGHERNTYEGKIEKRMFGLMNEVRYPIMLGKFNIAPAIEFNAVGYHIKGKEDTKEYSLNVKSQNNYSIESGIGLYANREVKPTKNSALKLNAGVAVYHEFADPYELELSMNDMSGSFKIRDEQRKDNRMVLRAGFDYKIAKKISLLGTFATYIDGTTYNNMNLDLKYNF